uniref:Glycoside hydrolase family 19 catalytic domain-containing protein n=1 Tax=Quercus lobata TaxID=97700 RepID=A0A7N2L5J9_QUELO
MKEALSCGYKVATKEPLAWGLCHNKEMNSNTYNYCDNRYENTYPCASGAAYYGRGPLPIYCFGTTMNVLYGDLVCDQGHNESMNNIISHYLYYLDLMGIGQEEARSHEVLSYDKQDVFIPSSSSAP